MRSCVRSSQSGRFRLRMFRELYIMTFKYVGHPIYHVPFYVLICRREPYLKDIKERAPHMLSVPQKDVHNMYVWSIYGVPTRTLFVHSVEFFNVDGRARDRLRAIELSQYPIYCVLLHHMKMNQWDICHEQMLLLINPWWFEGRISFLDIRHP